jgi:HEAT repeat protein
MTEVMRTGHPYRQVAACHSLADFGPAAVTAVPELIKMINESAENKGTFADGSSAAAALGKIAPGTPMANAAVCTLTEALQAQSEYTREAAATALPRFGAEATASTPWLRAMDNDPNPFVRRAASKALSTLAAEH